MRPTRATNYRGAAIIRILIADDTPQIRQALRHEFEKHSNWELCGEATNGLEAVSQAGELNPDIVILDLTMPNLNGFQAGNAIHSAAPKLPLLLFTQHEVGPQLEQEARNAGFRGVVNKSSFDLLIAGIESLLRGETFFTSDPPSKPDIARAARQTDVAESTKKEDALDEAS
jgi:DNA-binding NarL/FixJ family response regulator